MNRKPKTMFAKAVDKLGGQKMAAQILGRAQSTISVHCQKGRPTAELCMRVEIETGGAFRADQLRPDLADTFRVFREGEAASQRRRRSVA